MEHSEKYKFMRSAILNTNKTNGQINIFLLYNTRLSDKMLANTANALYSFLQGAKIDYSIAEVTEWIDARMGFSEYNHADKDATIFYTDYNGIKYFNYNTESSSGGVIASRAIIVKQ